MPTTPALSLERTGPTWKVIIRHATGTDCSYHHPTREAAQAAGQRMLANVPPMQACGRQRVVALVPVGRAGR